MPGSEWYVVLYALTMCANQYTVEGVVRVSSLSPLVRVGMESVRGDGLSTTRVVK